LGKNLRNQTSIAEEVKSRLRLGNTCYHSVQNVLFSKLLSKNLKIRIYGTINLCGRYCTEGGQWYCGLNAVCYSEQYVEGTAQQVDSGIVA